MGPSRDYRTTGSYFHKGIIFVGLLRSLTAVEVRADFFSVIPKACRLTTGAMKTAFERSGQTSRSLSNVW